MLSTHIMQEVEALADRLIIIDHGRIRADDSKADIYSHLDRQLTTIQVEFDSEVHKESLQSIQGAGKIKKITGRLWLIEAATAEDIRPYIFRYAVDQGITVLSMQQQEKSLEEVFRILTT